MAADTKSGGQHPSEKPGPARRTPLGATERTGPPGRTAGRGNAGDEQTLRAEKAAAGKSRGRPTGEAAGGEAAGDESAGAKVERAGSGGGEARRGKAKRATDRVPPAASAEVPADGRPLRGERASERRRQIVRAMLEVVAERGYDGASVAEVARRAGLAPGLVHYYFADKLAIACALVEHLGEVAAAREAERVARAAEGGRAMAAVDAYLARGPGAAPAVVACWVALGAEAVRRPEVRQSYGRVLGEVASRLGALMCLDGIATPAGARRDAAAVVAAIQGYFQLSVASPALVPGGSAAESVRAMMNGLRARAGAAGAAASSKTGRAGSRARAGVATRGEAGAEPRARQ